MKRKKTVLVLGAGASAPFGFPTGLGLGDEIRYHIKDELQGVTGRMSHLAKEVESFLLMFRKAGGIPIDEFLGRRKDQPGQVEIGKIAIATSLLGKEWSMGIFPETWLHRENQYERGKIAGLGGNWYELLWYMLTLGIPFNELDLSWLSVVTFNYDRSLEHFLYEAMASGYGIDQDEVKAKMRSMQIIHVHGSLGKLPWQALAENDPDVVPYNVKWDPSARASPQGDDEYAKYVERSARNIKIVYEAETTSKEFTQAARLVADAEALYFLGFGFHPVSVERLGLNKVGPKHPLVGGTTFKLAYDVRERLRRCKALEWCFIPSSGAVGLHPEDVYTFLHDHVSFEQ